MTDTTDTLEYRERIIAALLWYSTLLATAVVGTGMILGLLEPFAGCRACGVAAVGTMKAGIVLFIALPVARVLVLLVVFLRERDHVYTVISALVLLIIAIGMVAGR